MIMNRMLMVRMVSPMAMTGDTSAMAVDRSARFSSTNCIGHVLWRECAAAHQQAQRFPVGIGRHQRFREMTVEHHSDAVGDISEFVKVLAGDEDGSARSGKIEQRLTDH